MQLDKIKKEDLMFSGVLEDTCTNTTLVLDDYDWMTYTLTTRFRTKKMGLLNVKFEYCGCTESFMSIQQIMPNNNDFKYNFRFPTEIFIQYLTKFMNAHVASWQKKYAFDGEEIVLEFYNEVLDKGNLEY